MAAERVQHDEGITSAAQKMENPETSGQPYPPTVAVDHLVFGAPDLLTGIQTVEKLLGVHPAPGGKHLGVGTHNALVSLGAGAYLEVIAPDPAQPTPPWPRPYGLDALDRPRLLTWAAKAQDIESQAQRARAAGVDLGPVLRMSRERPDGIRLEWTLTRAERMVGDGLVPFLIAWDPGAHPSETSPTGGRLVAVRGEHPEPERIRGMLEAVGITLPLTRGPRPALIATVEGAPGTVELR